VGISSRDVSLGWDEGGDVWKWCRRLLVWEELVGKCRLLLHNVSLHGDIHDCWVWIPDPSVGYTVCEAYRLPTYEVPHHFIVVSELILHKNIMLKVSLFAWRML